MYRQFFGFGIGLFVILALSACNGSASAADCFNGLRADTPTPKVSQPTATPGGVITPTATIPPDCPTRTPIPTRTPRPTETAGPGLGGASQSFTSLTISPDNERVVRVASSNGQGGVFWRDAQNGLHLYLPESHSAIELGQTSVGDFAARVGEFAVAKVVDGRAQVLTATTSAGIVTAAPVPAPFPGDDVAIEYGVDGWLYLASAGRLARLNPFSGEWEGQGAYNIGAVKDLLRLDNGTFIFISGTAQQERRATDGGWSSCGDLPSADAAITAAGNNLAAAWTESGGWHAAYSYDGCVSWNGRSQASEPNQYTGAFYYAAFPLLKIDGSLEVTGLMEEPAGAGAAGSGDHDPGAGAPQISAQAFAAPAIVRLTANGWYPSLGALAESLTRSTNQIQPSRNFTCASSVGHAVCAWEVTQYNGDTDVVSLTR